MSVLETRVSNLASALQQDMLETALILRDALYDIHRLDALTGGLQYRLEKALTTLDFPHFIPIENRNDALITEYQHLEDLFWESMSDDSPETLNAQNYGAMADDLYKHLKTRCDRFDLPDRSLLETKEFPALPDDLDELIIEDMTRAVMKAESDAEADEALYQEYKRLNRAYWDEDELGRIENQIMCDSIFNELDARGFFVGKSFADIVRDVVHGFNKGGE